MSAFVGLTPVVSLRVANVLLGKTYPRSGSVEATVDTGYQGFIALPGNVFKALALDELRTVQRVVKLADGTELKSTVASGTVEPVGLGVEIDGPVETVPGLTEVLVGARFLSRFRLTLDYCLQVASLQACR